ncbi:MAG: UTP--glucose-1-phosphate uridylyltransferase [Elusimicrobiota bacterium]
MHELLKQYNYPSDEIEGLIEKYRQGKITEKDNIIDEKIDIPKKEEFNTLPPQDTQEYKEYREIGLQSIRKKQLGVVVLNGGMATRFGGVVKGIVEVFEDKSFLELKILNAMKVNKNIKFFIMNSFSTEDKTRKYLAERDYFGFEHNIYMFNQYIAPRITEAGDYYQAEDEKQCFYGPGHGDFPYCFKSSGMLKKFIKSGGKYIFFSNVDNLGARVDPAILGFHIKQKSFELTPEVTKRNPEDEGGAPVMVNGRLQLVEGFSFPKDLNQSGIPVMNCSTYWVDAQSLNKDFELPWYVVKKEVNGEKVIQFERLAGDLTKFLNSKYLKVPRSKRFFPVKRPEDLEANRKKLKNLLGY